MTDELEYNQDQNPYLERPLPVRAAPQNPSIPGQDAAEDGYVTFTNEQLLRFQIQAKLIKEIKNGMGWFYAIAGLTVFNSVVNLFNGDFYFVVGLGLSQLVSALGSLIAADFAANTGTIVQIVALGINLFLSGIFFLFGYFGNKGIKWVIVLGAVLYIGDALILLLWTDIVGIIFHGLALYYIFRALSALKKLEQSHAPKQVIDMPLHQ